MALDLIGAGFPTLEALDDDDGEVELTLGLSIGGSSRKAPREGAAPKGPVGDAGSDEAAAVVGGSGSSPPSSPPSPPSQTLLPQIDGQDALDPTRRREVHALRRQEARRKRNVKKQQKKGVCCGRRGKVMAAADPGVCGVLPPLEGAWSSDDRLAMEAQERQMRVKDREARVEETLDCVPNHKLSPGPSPNPIADAISSPSFTSTHSNPNLLIAMHQPYPHLQYVPITNGFGLPCMIPSWASTMSPVAEGAKNDRTVFQQVACRTLPSFLQPAVEPTNEGSPLSCDTVESNGGKGTGVKKGPSWAAFQGSSSSPPTSDHQSGSLRGGRSSSSNNSDARSHSGHQTPRKSQPQHSLQESSLPVGQSEDSTSSSHQIEPQHNAVEDPPSERKPPSCPNRSSSVNKPVSAAGEPRLPQVSPRMPCVSTTGNGPNGRTITGVLYRYTKTEVSIVCACHGSSFSPAEFVEHAGGVDVTHPLRQITVVSS